MQTIVKSFSEFLNLLVQAFNLSTLFPSLVFWMLVHCTVLPFWIPRYDLDLIDIFNHGSYLAVASILVVTLAYFLDAANMAIIRLFEGYTFMDFFPFDWYTDDRRFFVRKNLKLIWRFDKQAESLLALAEKEEDIDNKKSILLTLDALLTRQEECGSKIFGKYPEDPDYVLPTPFGNVIAEGEQYPYKVFGMDAVTLWPFLRPIITEKHYAEFILREKAIMDFILNLTCILMAFGVLFVGTELLCCGISMRLLIIASVIFLGCCVLCYLAVVSAKGWIVTIRTAFVYFRDDLRTVLGLPKPESYLSERRAWEEVSHFLQARTSGEEIAAFGQRLFCYEEVIE